MIVPCDYKFCKKIYATALIFNFIVLLVIAILQYLNYSDHQFIRYDNPQGGFITFQDSVDWVDSLASCLITLYLYIHLIAFANYNRYIQSIGLLLSVTIFLSSISSHIFSSENPYSLTSIFLEDYPLFAIRSGYPVHDWYYSSLLRFVYLDLVSKFTLLVLISLLSLSVFMLYSFHCRKKTHKLFCANCGYNLKCLDDGAGCPECGYNLGR